MATLGYRACAVGDQRKRSSGPAAEWRHAFKKARVKTMKCMATMSPVGLAIAALLPAALAQPAKYSERPIRLIVPFLLGDSVDVNARD